MSFAAVVAGAAAAGVTASGVAAVAGVVGAGVGLYGAYEGKKQQDKAYAASLAAFANDVEGAVTNLEWKRYDDSITYAIENQQRTSTFENYVDISWEMFNTKEDYLNVKTQLDSILMSGLTDVELGRLKATAAQDIKMINEMAQLEADYKLAMAQAANSEELTRAAIEAQSYADATHNAVRFIDQDIDTIKTQINQLREISDIQTKEAIGNELVKVANTVTAGGSRARKLMSTYLKADIMTNAQLAKEESAIDKAIAQQNRLGADAQAKMKATIDLAHNKVNANNASTMAAVNKLLNDAKLSADDKRVGLSIASNSLSASTNLKIAQMYGLKDTEIQQLKETTQSNIKDATNKYTVDSIYAQSVYDQSQYSNLRALETSLYTYHNKVNAEEGAKKINELYINNPDYVLTSASLGQLAGEKDNNKYINTILKDSANRVLATPGSYTDDVVELAKQNQASVATMIDIDKEEEV